MRGVGCWESATGALTLALTLFCARVAGEGCAAGLAVESTGCEGEGMLGGLVGGLRYQRVEFAGKHAHSMGEGEDGLIV